VLAVVPPAVILAGAGALAAPADVATVVSPSSIVISAVSRNQPSRTRVGCQSGRTDWP